MTPASSIIWVQPCCRLGSPGSRFWDREVPLGSALGIYAVECMEGKGGRQGGQREKSNLLSNSLSTSTDAFRELWGWDDLLYLSQVGTKGLCFIVPILTSPWVQAIRERVWGLGWGDPYKLRLSLKKTSSKGYSKVFISEAGSDRHIPGFTTFFTMRDLKKALPSWAQSTHRITRGDHNLLFQTI